MTKHLAVFLIGFLAHPLSAATAVPDLLKDARAPAAHGIESV